ncbi:unnamed protein product [Paramecium sonneborni]|uniref:Uncharacterized protein n=1 Tax=Paramecium sonneborni TaxID=65129 RepID=A0A8S1MU97_9CILI|nr:unnamed protein product [Paramecium sonneborni]
MNNYIGSNAYEYEDEIQIKNQKVLNSKGNTQKQALFDSYTFVLDEQPKSQDKKYDYDLYQIIGKKLNNPYAIDLQKGQTQKGNKTYEIEGDRDDFHKSRNDTTKQSNLLLTYDDDYQRITQSFGVDESVDSLSLEEYDYYEDINCKR